MSTAMAIPTELNATSDCTFAAEAEKVCCIAGSAGIMMCNDNGLRADRNNNCSVDTATLGVWDDARPCTC